MKKSVFLNSIIFTLVLYCLTASAQTQVRSYSATRTTLIPKIDGILNDDAWKTANVATDMIQFDPVAGAPASKKTEVRVIYDDYAIYVGAMMYDNAPDSILHELGLRDDFSLNADLFQIGFDTYNHQDPYIFCVNASGVQLDVKDQDGTYDAVWESAAKINDKGWAVEMKIPYSAIRFPSKPEQEWGFQFTRTIQRTKEYDQYAPTPKTASNSRLYWGRLKGISNVNAPVRLSITPFLMAYVEKAPVAETDQTFTYSNSFSYNAGADLKYGLDEKFTLDLTLLPDFSQVQSDNKVKNLSYQEVTYEENRSFFKEGIDLFNKNQLFYSRRIGKTPDGFYSLLYQLKEGETVKDNPSRTKLLNAVKLSGRNNNGLGIGLFNAVTDNMYGTIDDLQGRQRKVLSEPLTNYNVIVFDQQLKHYSSFYLINTNVIRAKRGKDANVTGTGFTLQNPKNSYAIDGSAALSQIFSINDSLADSYSDNLGYRYFFGFRKISGNFQFGVSHNFVNRSYDSRDIGYQVIANKMRERIYLDYNIYKPNKVFRESYNEILYDYEVNPVTTKPVNHRFLLSHTTILLDYSSINAIAELVPFTCLNYDEPRVPGRYFRGPRYYYLSAGYNSDSRKHLSFSLYFNCENYFESFKEVNYVINPGILYRLNDKMKVSYTLNYGWEGNDIGFADIDVNNQIIFGSRKLHTCENIVNLQYLFKNDLSLSMIGRHYWYTGEYFGYFTLLQDGNLEENMAYKGNNNFNYNVFNIDLVFSWQFAPGSLLTLVYKNAIENEGNEVLKDFSRNLNQTLKAPQTNSVSLKLFYYIDYQYLKRLKKRSLRS